MAPQVPPRPVQQVYRPSYSSFTSSYSPYGNSLYGGYSPYGYGGSYGLGGYSRLPHTEEVAPSRFVQQAEESSRGAFQSIESIVHAFASVSMMLDATFSAVYNSFRAVLDVANHLTRLRAHLTRVLSAFALVRTLRYLYRRLQRLLGRRSDSEVEDLWADSAADAMVTTASRAGPEDQTVKSWPIFLFFAVVLGGPYLIWKLLSSSSGSEEAAWKGDNALNKDVLSLEDISSSSTGTFSSQSNTTSAQEKPDDSYFLAPTKNINTTDWATGEDDHVVARAEFDFSAASEEEVSLRAGEMIILAPKEQQPRVRGWLLASVDGHITGLVPANYVKILGKRKGRKHAEMERSAQMQQGDSLAHAACPQPSSAPSLMPGLGLANVSSSSEEELLEGVYTETPAFSLAASDISLPTNPTTDLSLTDV